MGSHPSRVRGLKYQLDLSWLFDCVVAPFTGAWIEIEMAAATSAKQAASHPSRVRGLKFCQSLRFDKEVGSRTLHGCVD